jgi:hypothetical protein
MLLNRKGCSFQEQLKPGGPKAGPPAFLFSPRESKQLSSPAGRCFFVLMGLVEQYLRG